MDLIMEREQRSSKCVPKCCLFLFSFFFGLFFFFFGLWHKQQADNWELGWNCPSQEWGNLTVMMSSCRNCILIREKIAVPRTMICARLKFSLPLQGDWFLTELLHIAPSGRTIYRKSLFSFFFSQIITLCVSKPLFFSIAAKYHEKNSLYTLLARNWKAKVTDACSYMKGCFHFNLKWMH